MPEAIDGATGLVGASLRAQTELLQEEEVASEGGPAEGVSGSDPTNPLDPRSHKDADTKACPAYASGGAVVCACGSIEEEHLSSRRRRCRVNIPLESFWTTTIDNCRKQLSGSGGQNIDL